MIFNDNYTHYETLEISPNASFLDIRVAYKEILSIYDTDSPSTYSLFTPLERKNIFAQIEAAFHILSDPEKRKAYDTSLIAINQIPQFRFFIQTCPRGTGMRRKE